MPQSCRVDNNVQRRGDFVVPSHRRRQRQVPPRPGDPPARRGPPFGPNWRRAAEPASNWRDQPRLLLRPRRAQRTVIITAGPPKVTGSHPAVPPRKGPPRFRRPSRPGLAFTVFHALQLQAIRIQEEHRVIIIVIFRGGIDDGGAEVIAEKSLQRVHVLAVT